MSWAPCPRHSRREGIETRTLIPGYPGVLAAFGGRAEAFTNSRNLFGGPARMLGAARRRTGICSCSTRRISMSETGGPYVGRDGVDHPDNALRFAALARAGSRIAQGLLPNYSPDILSRA